MLCAATLLLVVGPIAADAAAESEAWLNARRVWVAQAAAIEDAAELLSDGGSRDDVRQLRRAVTDALDALDELEVHDCFRIWWSYVRTSYLLFDQALIGMERGDVGQVQVAVSSWRYLAAQAKSTVVDCPGKGLAPSGRGDARRGDSRWLVTRPSMP